MEAQESAVRWIEVRNGERRYSTVCGFEGMCRGEKKIARVAQWWSIALPIAKCFWSSPRPISDSQLHTLLHFHLCPIYLVVFKGSYFFRMGYLILRGASRLDAFSVYPFPTWLPGHAIGITTGTPEVSPSRSSRTEDSSSQISSAHAG